MTEEDSGPKDEQNDKAPEPVALIAPVPLSVSPPQPVITPETIEQEIKKEMSKFETAMVKLTWLGIAVTAITGGILYSQFRVMTDQTKILSDQSISAVAGAIESERNTRNQLLIAQQQASALQDEVTAIRQNFIKDERPHIAVVKYEMTDIETGKSILVPVVGKPVLVNIIFKNVGKSPALNLLIHRHLLFDSHIGSFRTEPIDKGTSGTALDFEQTASVTAVSIRDTFANESPEIAESEIINWDNSRIFVFGRASYRDSFGNSYCTPYMTTFLGHGSWATISGLDSKKLPHSYKTADLCPVGKY